MKITPTYRHLHNKSISNFERVDLYTDKIRDGESI